MQFMCYASEMSESSNLGEPIDLALLARRLVLEGMPVQSVIAMEAGVSQSTVSRAIQGRIKTSSPGARRLWDYTSSRVVLLDGGEEECGRRSSQKTAARRAPRVPRRRTDQLAEPIIPNREKLAEEALSGLRDYLNDAFDPLLVIEQLAVLRRAQDPQRLSGRQG